MDEMNDSWHLRVYAIAGTMVGRTLRSGSDLLSVTQWPLRSERSLPDAEGLA